MPTHGAVDAATMVATTALRVRLEVFCQALEEVIRLRVAAQSYHDYTALLAALSTGQTEIGWLPPLVALRSLSAGNMVPIALPIRGDSSVYSAALISRADSPIRSLKDLDGARAGWVDLQSTSGYIVIRAWLRSQGVDLDKAFAHEAVLGSHKAVVDAVLSGRADVGATFAHVGNNDKVLSASWGDAKVNVVGLIGPIPSDVLATHVHVPQSTTRAIQDALTGDMDQGLRGAALALFEADRFEAGDATHMAPLVKLLEHLEG